MMTAAYLRTRSPRPLANKARTIAQSHPYAVAAAVTAGALAILALVNRRLARNAENDNPPAGQFLEVNGVRLHYVERDVLLNCKEITQRSVSLATHDDVEVQRRHTKPGIAVVQVTGS